MQEKYAGDIGDFGKLILLKQLPSAVGSGSTKANRQVGEAG